MFVRINLVSNPPPQPRPFAAHEDFHPLPWFHQPPHLPTNHWRSSITGSFHSSSIPAFTQRFYMFYTLSGYLKIRDPPPQSHVKSLIFCWFSQLNYGIFLEISGLSTWDTRKSYDERNSDLPNLSDKCQAVWEKTCWESVWTTRPVRLGGPNLQSDFQCIENHWNALFSFG